MYFIIKSKRTLELVTRDFSKHFLPPLYGGKNSIFNWIFKLNALRDFFYQKQIVWKVNYVSILFPPLFALQS